MNEWRRDFAAFAQSDSSLPLPGGYSIRYLIFVLADGHIERARDIAERCTLADAVKWNHFRAYESKVQEDMMKRSERRR